MRKLNPLRFALLLAVILIMVASPVYAANTNTASNRAAQDDAGKVVVAPGDTIKVAVVTDLTGPIAEMGLDIEHGAEVALADFNAAGGVKGFQVEFIVEDDQCSPDEGTTVANRNVSNPEIVAVVGHVCSGATIAASDIYEEARIPMVSPSATRAQLTARGLDVVNRVPISDYTQGTVDANYLYKELGVTKLALMHDNDAYGQGLVEVVQQQFEALGGEVVAVEGINVADQDFRPVLTLIAAEEPEAVFFGGYKEQAILLVAQMKEVGLEDAIFFSDDGIYGTAFIEGAGDAAEGAYASFSVPEEVDPAGPEAFDTEYEDMFGSNPTDLGPYHYHAYDSAMMIFQAIDKASEVDADGNLVIDREALIQAVRTTAGYEGLTGNLTCDEKGDCGAGSIGISIVENGEWVPVEIPEDLVAPEAAATEAAQ